MTSWRLRACYDGTLSNESLRDARRLVAELDNTPLANELAAILAYGGLEIAGDWAEERGYHRDSVRHVVAW